jgi:hypothetical protein
MAFTSKQMSFLMTIIDMMRNERMEFEVPPLSLDDIKTMFIAEEDRSVMQRAADLLQMRYSDRHIATTINTAKYTDVRMQMRLSGIKSDGSAMFLVPKYASENATLLVPVSDALDAHITSMIDLRIDFEYIKRVLLSLDCLCASAAHVAFFWPSIRIIAERAAKSQPGFGDKLVDLVNSTTKKSVPALAPDLRQACKETAEIITAAHILGKPSSTPDLRYVMSLYHNKKHARITPLGPIHAQ